MSTAGEAASLFGVPDLAADPFATVLGGDDADTTIHATNSNALSEQQASTALDIFGAESTDWLGGGELPPSHPSERGDSSARASYTYGASEAAPSVSAASYYPQHQDQYGHASGYGQPSYQDSAGAYLSHRSSHSLMELR